MCKRAASRNETKRRYKRYDEIQDNVGFEIGGEWSIRLKSSNLGNKSLQCMRRSADDRLPLQDDFVQGEEKKEEKEGVQGLKDAIETASD